MSSVAVVVTVWFALFEVTSKAVTLHGCDSSHVCPCVSGDRNSCFVCNGCYEQVRATLHRERQRFSSLMDNISSFNRSLSTKTFAQRLSDEDTSLEVLAKRVDDARTQENELDQRLEFATNSLDEIQNKSLEIQSGLVDSNLTAFSAHHAGTMIERLVNDTKVKITRAYTLLVNKSKPEVDMIQSIEGSIVGLANVASGLVQDAVNETSKQELQAAVLNERANLTHQLAVNAKMATQEAFALQISNKKQLNDFVMLVANRSLKYTEAKANVMNSKAMIEMAIMEAEDAKTRANELSPNLKLSQLQEQLGEAQQQTTSLIDQLSTTVARFSVVVNATTSAHSDTSQLSRTIHISVDKVDYLRSRVNRAYEQAMKHAARSQNIISNAEDMLNILTNFSQVINATRSRAMEALQLVNTIEELSRDATTAAQEVLTNHQQAVTDAKLSMKITEEALVVAQDALVTTTEIQNDIMTLKMTSNADRNEAERLLSNATTLNMTANDLLLSCLSTTADVDSTASDIQNTISNQTICSTNISQSGMEVDQLQQEIANFKQLDGQQIALLKLEVSKLSDQLSHSSLTRMVTAIEEQQREDLVEIDRYNSLISELERDTDNLEEIIAAGADICIKV